TMYQVQLGFGVAEGPSGLADVDDLVRQRYRIACREPADLVVVRPDGVGVRNRPRRIEGGDILEHATLKATLVFVGEVGVVDARARDIEADPQAVVQIRVRGTEPPLNPLQPARERHALLVRVVERCAIVRVFTSAREGWM